MSMTKKERDDLDEAVNWLIGCPTKKRRNVKRLEADHSEAAAALREAAAHLDPGVLSADGREETDTMRARTWIYFALLRCAGR